MKQGVVISTWSGGREQFECLYGSIIKPFKYGLLVVVNDGENADWIEHNFDGTSGIYKIPYDGYELGALKTALEVTDWDEFFLLQDTFEVINQQVFDMLFENYPDQSVSYGPDRQMFLAKYRRAILEQLSIPRTKTKMESIVQEVRFIKKYEEIEPFVIFNHGFTDAYFLHNTEFRWGRENIVLRDDYLIKRKGTWELPRQMPKEYQDFLAGKYD